MDKIQELLLRIFPIFKFKVNNIILFSDFRSKF